MSFHRPGALRRLDAASIGAIWIASVALFATPGVAQDKQPRTEVAPFHHGLHAAPAAGPTAYDEASPPLFGNLGQHTWAITIQKPEAQAFFDQGLRLAYGFNHAEARRAFRQAQRLDPSCAMCFWGEAYVLGPNINVPMEASANAPALAARTGAGACSPCQPQGAGAHCGSGQAVFGRSPGRPRYAGQGLGGCTRRSRPTLSG